MGFTNLITFPGVPQLHEVVRQVPLSRILLETDAPYFVPRVYKTGRIDSHRPAGCPRNVSHPGMAIHVAAQIAALKGITVAEVVKTTRANTRTVYKL